MYFDDTDIQCIRSFVAYFRIDHNIETLKQVTDIELIEMCKNIVNRW